MEMTAIDYGFTEYYHANTFLWHSLKDTLEDMFQEGKCEATEEEIGRMVREDETRAFLAEKEEGSGVYRWAMVTGVTLWKDGYDDRFYVYISGTIDDEKVEAEVMDGDMLEAAASFVNKIIEYRRKKDGND